MTPVQYESHTDVMEPVDTLEDINNYVQYGIISTIPEDYNKGERYMVEIQSTDKKQYVLRFEPIDPILPDKITVEITEVYEYGWDDIRAYCTGLENDLYQIYTPPSMVQGLFDNKRIYNWFKYSEHPHRIVYYIT